MAPTPQPKKTPVALVGLGGVGVAIMQQLLSPPLASKFRLVMIANSKKYLYNPQPTSPDFSPSTFKEQLDSRGQAVDLPAMIGALATHPDGPAIFIDSTATDTIPQLYPTILQMNIHVVTPNKKGFSGSLSLAQAINGAAYPSPKQGSLVYGESTVGAGLPILSTLKDLLETGDEIIKIEGVFSGTLSYIFNEFSKVEGGDVKFSEVVKIAKEKGYTEPDPRDDLSGTDVARKLTILTRLCSTQTASLPFSLLPEGYASVPTSSLVPEVLQGCKSKEEYVERLAEGDAEMDRLREEAFKEGKVVRYVGVIDAQSGKVEAKLEKYPFDHPFATALKGSDNIISFHTKRYSPRPLIIQGAGAGADVTAMGVTSDCLKVHERLRLKAWGSVGF
ncbi:Homoserine dehydrogenase [Naganishia albida]|nr:Homoserine dehydrogenase [Naganishia albida]